MSEPSTEKAHAVYKPVTDTPDCYLRPGEDAQTACPLYGDCVFQDMWERAGNALAAVYDSTTFQVLLDEDEKRKLKVDSLSYAI